MIAAIDVHYSDDASATVGAVVFPGFFCREAYRTYTKDIPEAEDYVPGQFYRRELPCIMAILGVIEEEIAMVIIDGYVDLGEKPGLGRYLWQAFGGKKKVIGVAKTHFQGSDAIKVFRGKSKLPLYITSAGIEPSLAACLIEGMYGEYRLPALLKQADTLCRGSK